MEDSSDSDYEPEPWERVRIADLPPITKPPRYVFFADHRDEEFIDCSNYGRFTQSYKIVFNKKPHTYNNIKVVGFTKAFLKDKGLAEKRLLAWCIMLNPTIDTSDNVGRHGQFALRHMHIDGYKAKKTEHENFCDEDDTLGTVSTPPGVFQHIQVLENSHVKVRKTIAITYHPIPIECSSLCPVARKSLVDLISRHKNCAYYVKERYFREPGVKADFDNIVMGKSVFVYYHSLGDYIVNYHTSDDFFPYSFEFEDKAHRTVEFIGEHNRDNIMIQHLLKNSNEFVYIDFEKKGLCTFDIFTNFSEKEIAEYTNSTEHTFDMITSESIMCSLSPKNNLDCVSIDSDDDGGIHRIDED